MPLLPKNRPYIFRRKRLKPLANQGLASSGVIVSDTLDA
jgi:hypothetical protein